jgi:hypothetical protein
VRNDRLCYDSWVSVFKCIIVYSPVCWEYGHHGN